MAEPRTRRKLLFVDDDREFLAVTAETLGESGRFEVTTAEDVMDAYMKAADTRFDAICTDYRLGGLTGRELIELLRSHPTNRDVPIAVLSGFSSTSREACGSMGNLLFLNKPISGRDLEAALYALAVSCPSPGQTDLQTEVDTVLVAALRSTLNLYRVPSPEIGHPKPVKDGLFSQVVGQLPLHWGRESHTVVFAFEKRDLDALTANFRTKSVESAGLAEFLDIYYATLSQKAAEARMQLTRSVPMISSGQEVRVSCGPKDVLASREIRFASGRFQMALVTG